VGRYRDTPEWPAPATLLHFGFERATEFLDEGTGRRARGLLAGGEIIRGVGAGADHHGAGDQCG